MYKKLIPPPSPTPIPHAQLSSIERIMAVKAWTVSKMSFKKCNTIFCLDILSQQTGRTTAFQKFCWSQKFYTGTTWEDVFHFLNFATKVFSGNFLEMANNDPSSYTNILKVVVKRVKHSGTFE